MSRGALPIVPGDKKQAEQESCLFRELCRKLHRN